MSNRIAEYSATNAHNVGAFSFSTPLIRLFFFSLLFRICSYSFARCPHFFLSFFASLFSFFLNPPLSTFFHFLFFLFERKVYSNWLSDLLSTPDYNEIVRKELNWAYNFYAFSIAPLKRIINIFGTIEFVSKWIEELSYLPLAFYEFHGLSHNQLNFGL